PILLILDSHNSHLTYENLNLAADNNVIVFCLPPHTTHHLQPCDVGAFGPLKQSWQEMLQKYYDKHGCFIPICNVIKVYIQACTQDFKGETIQAAWNKSGIDVTVLHDFCIESY
ncbi:hypothetical protein GYMLUDRAFT_145703, partial [Collybiopsis luxurians FD-317 M1]